MAEQTPTQRKATAKKAAATRKRNAAARSAKTAKSSAKATRTSASTAAANATGAGRLTLDSVQLQAERAVLIPVGAALVARDTVLEAAKPFRSRTSVEKELKKFERRGSTARNSVRREVKRTRTRVERELRHRRNDATDLAKRVQEQVAALA
jgi:hypothetical protein